MLHTGENTGTMFVTANLLLRERVVWLKVVGYGGGGEHLKPLEPRKEKGLLGRH